MDYNGTWNNTGGTVTIDATSTLNLDGNMVANGLGTISNSAGGTVNVTGKLDNTGNNLTFSPSHRFVAAQGEGKSAADRSPRVAGGSSLGVHRLPPES